MSLEPITVDLAAVGFQEESGLPAMSAPGEALTVTTRCDRLIAFWRRGAPVRSDSWGFKLDGGPLDMTLPVREGTPPLRTASTLAALPAGEAGTVPTMRTQTGDVAGTLDTMGPGTGQAAKGGVLYPDLEQRLGLPAQSALERGDFPLPPVELLAVSTFSGVGGLDRGLRLAGIESVLQAEQDEWCREILAHRFPGTSQISDVRNVDLEHVEAALTAWEEFTHGTEGVPQGDEGSGRGRGRQSGEVGADGSGGNGDGRGRLDTRGRSGSARIDLLHGGFPCQDVSVAGRRAGLDGARTGLFFEFARIADALRPSWVLLENVPGLLTSNGGRDFGVILDTLANLGYGLAWRVLDSRYFGVPQRRRRVFIVGRLGGDGASALRALCESCVGSSEAGSCSWQTPALRTRARPEADGGLDLAGALTRRHAGSATARDGVDNLAISGPLLGGGADRGYRLGVEESASLVATGDPEDVAHTLTAGGFDASEDGTGRGTPLVPTGPQRTRYFDWQKAGAHAMSIEDELAGSLGTTRSPAILEGVSATLQAKRGKGGGGLGPEETLLPVPAHERLPDQAVTLTAMGGGSNDPELENLLPIPLSADTAGGRSGDAETPSPDAEGNVRLRPPGLGVGEHGDPSFTLAAGAPPAVWAMQPGPGDGGEIVAQRVDQSPTLGTGDYHSDRGARVRAAAGVRRLTPVECERLQGFPDDWTSVPGVKCPDGRRYAAMGNAVTVNVGEWIGRRILAEHRASQA